MSDLQKATKIAQRIWNDTEDLLGIIREQAKEIEELKEQVRIQDIALKIKKMGEKNEVK